MIIPNKQYGLSLIELMIAITLSLILMAGSTQFLISANQSYQINDDISRIQENGRIGLDILVRDIRKAGGYDTAKGSGTAPDLFYTGNCGHFSPAAPCTSNNVQSSPNFSDAIAVEYNPSLDDGTETDCTGTNADGDIIIANVYWVANTAPGINSLFCRGFNRSAGAWHSPAAQPLIDGIDSMQILYGIPDASGSVSQFVSADRVASWLAPKAVRVSLLVSNGLDTGFAENRTRIYSVLDANRLSITDRSPRRIYSTTIYLNN